MSKEECQFMRYILIENIVTLLVTFFGCWLISGWFAVCLLNLTHYSIKPKPNADEPPVK